MTTTAQTLAGLLAGVPRNDNGSCNAGLTRSGKLTSALRPYLIARQDGICPMCGLDSSVGELSDLCHIIPALTKPERGYLPGNIFAGHRACNLAMSNNDWSSEFMLSAMFRADVIATDWNGFSRDRVIAIPETEQTRRLSIIRDRINSK